MMDFATLGGDNNASMYQQLGLQCIATYQPRLGHVKVILLISGQLALHSLNQVKPNLKYCSLRNRLIFYYVFFRLNYLIIDCPAGKKKLTNDYPFYICTPY